MNRSSSLAAALSFLPGLLKIEVVWLDMEPAKSKASSRGSLSSSRVDVAKPARFVACSSQAHSYHGCKI
ncbi:hypothetical protein NL676_025818 [Syzygium grande]|nr:hypothetical protein NL676_025818 [Syzygium grande]